MYLFIYLLLWTLNMLSCSAVIKIFFIVNAYILIKYLKTKSVTVLPFSKYAIVCKFISVVDK